LDHKESKLIDNYLIKIEKNEFDENDIYTFLILLRRHAKKKSPVFEFANFVAHREKDRGEIHEYIRKTKHILDNIGKINATMVIKPVYTEEEIKDGFNEVLTSLGKNTISDKGIRGILLCIIVLLQDVRLVTKKNYPIGKLVLGISQTQIVLLGEITIRQNENKGVSVIFPALEIPNTYFPILDKNPRTFKVLFEVVNKNGELNLELTDIQI